MMKTPSLVRTVPRRPLTRSHDAPYTHLRPRKTTLRRCASTSSAPMKSASTPSASAVETPLDWPSYFSLRASRRRYGTIFSIPTTLAGFAIGGGYVANLEADDPSELIMGIAPAYAYGIGALGTVALGWLAGPFVGSGVWKLSHRRVMKAMELKDKQFHPHIIKNRADPSRQSASNPAPDYYCEKVGSVKQYRQWLRDQNAYRRKATFGDEA